MKRPPDAGLAYMMELGIKPAKDFNGVYAQFQEKMGQTRADEIRDAIYYRRNRSAQGQKTDADNVRFYELKNQDFLTSMTLSGAHDGDILRKTCNWIDGHREPFGATILDVGCDCGIISCFLAKTFPDSQIISIDLSANAIQVARELAERLGLSNISFRHSRIENLPAGEYDTVFSSRTVNENSDPLEENAKFFPLSKQGQICSKVFRRYARLLTDHIRPGGHLVSIERLERDRAFLGYCLALHDCSMDLCNHGYEELNCHESDRESHFQALYAVKDAPTDETQAMDFFCGTFEGKITWLPQHLDVEGELILDLCAQKLIRGFYLHNHHGTRVGKLAIYTSKYDEDGLFYYQGFLDQPVRVSRYDRERTEELLQFLTQELESFAEGKINAHPFQFLDGEELLLNDPDPFL